MAKCNRETHPELFGYLEGYGLDPKIIEKIDRIKGRSSSGYYVVGFPESDGMIGMLDVSNTPDRTKFGKIDLEPFGWNMLNDSVGSVTESDWNKIKIDPYCETFTIPGHEDYE